MTADALAESPTEAAASSGPPAPPLRVLVVEFPPSGGMFQYAFQFGRSLAQAGHEVTLLTGPDPELTSDTDGLQTRATLPTWHPNAQEPGGPWRRKARRAARALRLLESWRRVLVQVRRTRPDIVQFGELRYPLDTAALLTVIRFGRQRMTVDVAHNPLPYDVTNPESSVEKTGRLSRFLLDRAYRACDLVLVLGEGPRSQLEANFPRVRRTAVCGHGDYAAIFDAPVRSAPSAAPPHVLFFGAWTKYKNIPLLLDAFALARVRCPEARLTLAGPVMPDIDAAAVEARAVEVGQVDLYPGYVPMEELPALFARHRAVVFTYDTVNISGSVHMAYTFGRPVVATDVGSMSDAVENDRTGLLTAPDPASIADAIVRILSDPELADRLGLEAARRGTRDASWTAVATRATDAYRRALTD